MPSSGHGWNTQRLRTTHSWPDAPTSSASGMAMEPNLSWGHVESSARGLQNRITLSDVSKFLSFGLCFSLLECVWVRV